MSAFIGPVIGGALIGLSAVTLMAMTGRIAGISGIVASLLPPKPANDAGWRLAFVLGLILAAFLSQWCAGKSVIGEPAVPIPHLVAAGLLVGIGTVLGGGCTSGHGICGIARLSPRSVIAVVVFMACACVTVFVVRHVL